MATHPFRRTRGIGIAFAVAGLVAVVATGSVSASAGATTVRGTQLAYGTCGDGTGYQMTGALRGCWWIDTFVTKSDETKSHYVATGEEHFTGWIGSLHGTFTTTYRFTAKTDGPWPTSAEIHGRCHHPITGGSGDFAGITGEISFHDVVDVSPPYYPYWGNVRLGKSAASSSSATLQIASGNVSRTASTSAAGTTC
jgi:hypothetical protein